MVSTTVRQNPLRLDPLALPTTMQEREKKKKYLQACLDQRRHFSPFVVSCDGFLGNEAKDVVLQNFAGSLAKKSGKSYVFRNFKLH